METMQICQAIYDFKCAFVLSEANRMGLIDDDAYCKVLTSVLQQMDMANKIIEEKEGRP